MFGANNLKHSIGACTCYGFYYWNGNFQLNNYFLPEFTASINYNICFSCSVKKLSRAIHDQSVLVFVITKEYIHWCLTDTSNSNWNYDDPNIKTAKVG